MERLATWLARLDDDGRDDRPPDETTSRPSSIPAPSSPAPGPRRGLVFVGDSLDAPATATPRHWAGWVGSWRAPEHADIDLTAYNLGVRGDSSTERAGPLALGGPPRWTRTAAEKRLVVSVGSQRRRRRHDDGPHAAEPGQHHRRCRRDRHRDVRRSGPADARTRPSTDRLEVVVDAQADVCARRSVPFVDCFDRRLPTTSSGADLCTGDGMHPGQAGYGLIAWLVLHCGWPSGSPGCTCPACHPASRPSRPGARAGRDVTTSLAATGTRDITCLGQTRYNAFSTSRSAHGGGLADRADPEVLEIGGEGEPSAGSGSAWSPAGSTSSPTTTPHRPDGGPPGLRSRPLDTWDGATLTGQPRQGQGGSLWTSLKRFSQEHERLKASLSLAVPSGTDVTVCTVSAEGLVTGVRAGVRCHTVSGSLTLADIGARWTPTPLSGHIECHELGATSRASRSAAR